MLQTQQRGWVLWDFLAEQNLSLSIVFQILLLIFQATGIAALNSDKVAAAKNNVAGAKVAAKQAAAKENVISAKNLAEIKAANAVNKKDQLGTQY